MFLFFLTALVLGMRHSLDPDHLVAVSTLVSEERRLWPAARLGFIWGIGHLIPLALIGLPVILLRLHLPEALENTLDLGVGVLLVALGARTLLRLWKEQVHFHIHHHDGSEHAHFHAHAQSPRHDHAHPNFLHRLNLRRQEGLTFGIGMAHGLAGSGAAALLALSHAPSLGSGVLYLLIFGAGTCAGMFCTTLLIAAPALTTLSRYAALYRGVRAAAGVVSIGFGIFMWVQNLPHVLS